MQDEAERRRIEDEKAAVYKRYHDHDKNLDDERANFDASNAHEHNKLLQQKAILDGLRLALAQ